MSFRKNNSKVEIIVDGRCGDRLAKFAAVTKPKAKAYSTSSTTSTKVTCASTLASKSYTSSITPTKETSDSRAATAIKASAPTTATSIQATTSSTASNKATRPTVAEIKAASKQDEFDDELESMLSLSQTLSFWDGDGDEDGETYANSYDNTSYSGNTYDSSSTYDYDGRRGRGRGHRHRDDRYNNRVVSCGDGLDDTLETFAITGRAISSALKIGTKSMNSMLFMGKLKQQLEKKDITKKQREEEMRMKREAQLREEMMASRYEISNVANLWREK